MEHRLLFGANVDINKMMDTKMGKSGKNMNKMGGLIGPKFFIQKFKSRTKMNEMIYL